MELPGLSDEDKRHLLKNARGAVLILVTLCLEGKNSCEWTIDLMGDNSRVHAIRYDGGYWIEWNGECEEVGIDTKPRLYNLESSAWSVHRNGRCYRFERQNGKDRENADSPYEAKLIYIVLQD